MSQTEEFKPFDAELHTGTENLYWYIFKDIPPQDIRAENLPQLLAFLRSVSKSGKASERAIQFFGIGCKPVSFEILAEVTGVGKSSIQNSLRTIRRNICLKRKEFLAFYGIIERTHRGCILPSNAPIMITDLQFSTQTRTALRRIGFWTLGDLLRKRKVLEEEMETVNIGQSKEAVLTEIQAVLKGLDLLVD